MIVDPRVHTAWVVRCRETGLLELVFTPHCAPRAPAGSELMGLFRGNYVELQSYNTELARKAALEERLRHVRT